jgi:probable HAF family extracellular repeat protein
VTLASLATRGDTDIEPFAGFAANDHGQILGWGKRPGVDGLRGFVLDLASAQMTDIGTLQGTPTSSARPADLNEQGHVVGESQAPSFFTHAFVWEDGVMTDLHVAGGVPGRNSHAQAINESGVVVGDADPTADFLDYQNAAMWEDGVLTLLPDLGDVGGVIESFARDVNDHGTIVGASVTPAFEVHAVIWRDGQVTDLNTLLPPGSGWLLFNAFAISNDGRIFGEGLFSGAFRPFVLVPDSDGGFDVYGGGCAGGGGFVPGLWGQGWPQGSGEMSLALTNGEGGAGGLLLVGLDDQTAPFKGCTLSVLPLTPISLPLLLTPGGPGAGQWGLEFSLPPAVPMGSIFLQAALIDPGVPSGVTLTNGLRIDLVP